MKTNEKMKINVRNTAIILLIYRILLDIVVETVMKDKFTYLLGKVNFNIFRFLITTVIILFFSKNISKFVNTYKVSNSLVVVLFLFYYIPSWVFFTWYDVPLVYALAILIHSSLLIIFNNRIPEFKIKLKRNEWSNFQFNLIVWIILITAIAITGYYNGFELHFRLDDVYELRTNLINASLPTIVRYIQPIGGTVIPFFIIYFLDKKKYVMAGICTFTQFLLFSFGGQKTYLFYILCAYASYFIMKKRFNINWFTKAIAFITGLGIIEYFITKTFYICNYVIRRVMIVPAALSTFYFDFFSKNSPDFWRQSIMRWLGFKSQYTENISYIIGETYFNDSLMMANNGMIGDAFANFGWIGIIFFPLLLVLSFKLLDGCAKGISIRVTFMLAIIYGMNFTNGAFWARMLTSGFMFVYIITLTIPRDNKEEEGVLVENIKENNL